jgi:3-methylcrotonyl-CoA carboxylase alpha subunit
MADRSQGSRPIRRILIANRGEIAVRIARTCRDMGIGMVAVYSTADARALHVLVADEAVCIGPPPSSESYLNIEAILNAARTSGADAIHPGYGFLAENPRFAAAVESAGLVWIGPPADVIALMGAKVAAKELARQAGVPTVPGYMGEDQSIEALSEAADSVGYPVLLKAAAGGGGKGMRAVAGRDELADAIEGARREARSAFGDDRIFLEKMLVRPRHVEVQVLTDAHGNAVYLGDRDCSLQRRHQKVIEEAPAPGLPEAFHRAMGADAVRLALAAGYVNAGTVEFLFDGEKQYFLEMNTRVQVEHPVTEMVTGLDLVRLQIEVAAGAALPFRQDDVQISGHAIEARIYAEDPAGGFLPSTGTIRVFETPGGDGVRNDVGVYRGFEVTPYYDPILAKLVVVARSRSTSIGKLVSALNAYDVQGLVTNLPLLRWAAAAPEYGRAEIDIEFLEREWRPDLAGLLPPEVLAAAAAHDLLTGREETAAADVWNPWGRRDGWRMAGAPRRLLYHHGGGTHAVEAFEEPPFGWRLAVDGNDFSAEAIPGHRPRITLRHAGTGVEAIASRYAFENALEIHWAGRSYRLDRGPERAGGAAAGAGRAGGGPTAPMPGTVVKVAVESGQRVTAHQPLVVLEAMKMEHVVEAPSDGVVTEVLVEEGDLVLAGSPVVTLEPA